MSSRDGFHHPLIRFTMDVRTTDEREKMFDVVRIPGGKTVLVLTRYGWMEIHPGWLTWGYKLNGR